MSSRNSNNAPRQLSPPADAATDEYLASVTVGKRIPHNDRILLVPYNPHWPTLFSQATNDIRNALGEKTLRLEHVGSTSVAGLSAKPIIDMVLTVQDSSDEGSYVLALEATGFVLRIREPDWFDHRFLVRKSGNQTWQLHVFSAECEEVDRAHNERRIRYRALSSLAHPLNEA